MSSTATLSSAPSSSANPPPSDEPTLAGSPNSTPSPTAKGGLYKIDDSNADNMCMRAAVDITPGVRIHTEKPLMTYSIVPAKMYNPNSFWNPMSPFSGTEALKQHLDNLPDCVQSAIGALKSPESTDPVEKVQFNAFDSDTTSDGGTACIIRVYKDLSRINHSCRPNAVVEWNNDPAVQAGTLLALTNIPKGAEISICYLAGPRDCLKVIKARVTEFTKSYRFSCACDSCGSERVQAADDNRNRSNAIKLYRSTSANIDRTDATLAIDIQAWIMYIELLKNLMLFDTKISDAYDSIAALQSARASAALQLQNVGDHCEECDGDGNGVNHMNCAIDALNQALQVELRCLGADDPRVLARHAKLAQALQSRERHVN